MNETGIERMVRDLQALAVGSIGDVGAVGLRTEGAVSSDRGSEILRHEAAQILSMVRPAWEALDGLAFESTRERAGAARPRGSLATVAPLDWQSTAGRWLPTRWQVPAIELERDPVCRRWLIHAAGLAGDFFAARHERILEWVGDAKHARVVGSSEWAAQAEIELDSLSEESSRTLAEARRVGSFIQSADGRRLTASSRPPAPFPREAIWHQLRRHVINLENPRALVPEMVASSLKLPIATCEIPLLYQRWVGIQIVQTLQRQGWTIANDPLGPLWLGGSILAIRDGAELRFDVEQRYVSRASSGADLECVLGETLTPDFTIRFEAPWGHAAWILDATLTQDPEFLFAKQQKYLAGLRMSRARLVAGVPTFARPSRSWVAAPLGGRIPQLTDTDGTTGTFSVDPSQAEHRGLEVWLQDLRWSIRDPRAK